MSKIFTPHELKTIEIDAEKKIFRINGEDFGDGCTGFSIHCKYEGFKVRVEIDTTVTYVTYDEDGKKQTEETYKTNDPWFTD